LSQRQKDTISILLILLLAISAVLLVWFTPPNLGLDLQGGLLLVLTAEPSGGGKVTETDIDQAQFIIEDRVNGLGVTEPQIERQVGTPNIIVQLPGIKNPDEAVNLIRSTALLEFKEVVDPSAPANSKKRYGPTLMTGKALQSARVGTDQLGRANIEFTLTPQGTKKFREITARLAPGKKQLAIILDGKEVSAPAVQGEIAGGKGEITGKFTFDQAKNLALVLNTGALPVKLDIAQKQTVGPTLGRESLRQALIAGLVGLLLVAIYMLIMYRGLGFISIAALLVFACLFAGTLTLIGATLTLPGIAGIILTIGLAADSGIVYFERFREEFRHGREPRAAAKTGFGHAFRTIIDADATTLIIAATLIALSYLYFGAGPVRGFAVTLSIGITLDVVTSFFFTRPVLIKLSDWSLFRNPLVIGVRRSES
jgi:preprotein translocase subunit SecD